jgi:hypothetical protein
VWGTCRRPPTSGPARRRGCRWSRLVRSNVLTLRTSATDAVERAAQSAAQPFAVPDGLCPKCLARRGAELSCAHCGLDFGRVTTGTFAVAPWLDERWRALLLDWSNDAFHSTTRADAASRGALPELGRLYRLRLAWFPDDPWAETGREEVLRLAASAVATQGPAAQSSSNSGISQAKLVLSVLVVLGFFAMAAMLWVLVFRSP